MRKSRIVDVVVIVASSAVAALSLGAFYADLNSQLSAGERPRVGTVTYKRLQAQRKYADRVVWESVAQESPVYAQDYVRTSAGSEAVIALDDGTVINLYEDTMVQLEWSEDAAVSFVTGNLVATNAAGDARVRAGDVLVELEGAASISTSGGGGAMSVAAAKGEVRLVKGGATTKVGGDEVASVASGKVAVAKASVRGMKPRSGDVIEIPERSATVQFSWEAESDRYEIQVSSDASFSRPVEKGTVIVKDGAVQASYRADLPAGPWFWRVRPVGSSEWVSGAFSVRSRIAIESTAPARDRRYEFRDRPPEVAFSWNGPEGSTYLLEISSTPGFSPVAVSRKVKSTSLAVALPGEGTWYWRVTRLVSSASYEVSTVTETRSLVAVKLASLSAAVLTSPPETVSVLAAADSGIVFSWKPGPDIVRSELVIARDGTFADVLARRDAGRSSYWVEKDLVTPGRYWYRVRTFAPEGAEAPVATGTFVVVDAKDAIKPKSPVDGFVAQRDKVSSLAFAWISDLAKPLLVEIASDKAFANVVATATGVSRVSAALPEPGAYWWRVVFVDARGRRIATSPARSLIVAGPLAAPANARPAAGSAIRLVNQTSLAFSWDPVPAAATYDLELWKEGAWGPAIRAYGLASARYVGEGATSLGTGTFTLKLKARAPAGDAATERESAWSETVFVIEENRALPAAIALSPADGSVVDGLVALKQGFALSFRVDSKVASSVVTIARDPAFRVVALSLRVKGGAVDVPRRFEPGNYWWRVESFASDGFAAPVSATGRFTVAKAPELAKPVAVAPALASKVDAFGLAALSFEWKPVAGATAYDWKLVDPATGAVVASATRVPDAKAVVADLATLREGDYLWVVEALDVASDGVVDRRASATFRFSLFVSLKPVAPELQAAVIYEAE